MSATLKGLILLSIAALISGCGGGGDGGDASAAPAADSAAQTSPAPVSKDSTGQRAF